MKEVNSLNDLVGLVITEVRGLEKGSDEVIFEFEDGNTIVMLHEQDCCEHVELHDICGDEGDLVGGTIIEFRESTNTEDTTGIDYPESFTWTFYNISTTKGYVNMRWLGESNGYYSESVDVINPNKEATYSWDKRIN